MFQFIHYLKEVVFLKLLYKLSEPEIDFVSQYLGEDGRDHQDEENWEGVVVFRNYSWNNNYKDTLTYFDLEFEYDENKIPIGLRWNGCEKTYDLVEKLNIIIVNTRKKFPNFGLKGKMRAKGEDMNDNWYLKIGDDGLVYSEYIDLD